MAVMITRKTVDGEMEEEDWRKIGGGKTVIAFLSFKRSCNHQ